MNWVCSPCCKKLVLSEEKLIESATMGAGAKLVEFLSQGASCVSY